MRSPLPSLVLAAALPASALAQDYDAPRTATVNAAGATLLKVDARAGSLRVTGRPDITEVRIKGTARASSRNILDDIKLEATRNGNEVTCARPDPRVSRLRLEREPRSGVAGPRDRDAGDAADSTSTTRRAT